jgi:hypothetical protein
MKRFFETSSWTFMALAFSLLVISASAALGDGGGGAGPLVPTCDRSMCETTDCNAPPCVADTGCSQNIGTKDCKDCKCLLQSTGFCECHVQ